MLLTPKAIVVAALELIDAEGLEAFSTRKLGAAVGVEAMSVYHHFKSKAALLDAVADHLVSLARQPPPLREDWKSHLREAGWAFFDLAKAHPRAFGLIANRRLNGPASFAWFEGILAAMAVAGLDPALQAKIARMIGTFINGSGMMYAATLEAGARDHPMNDFPLADAYPFLAGIAPYTGLDALDDLFAFGLETMLDQIERSASELQGRTKKIPIS